MKYIEFLKAMKNYPVFSIHEIEKRFPGFDSRRLTEWQEKGYIRKLRNRYYCFPNRVSGEPGLYFTANVLYSPSYVSLETALTWYGFIPERAFQIISCTTRKTQSFETPLGKFSYRHLKTPLFFGYRMESWESRHYLIADAEKTVIDYLYLHPELQEIRDIMALRWNAHALNEELSVRKLDRYGDYINSHALRGRIKLFKEFLHARAG